MEKVSFKLNIKPKSRFSVIKEISNKCKDDVKMWLGILKDFDDKDIDNIYRSVLAHCKDKDIPFKKSLLWHIREINKSSK